MTNAILTCSPHFTDLALNEIHRSRPDVTVSKSLAPGYVLLQASYSFDKLTVPWRHRLPIYLHHLFPVHRILDLNGTEEDLALLKETIEQIVSRHTVIQIRNIVESGLPYSVWDVEQVLGSQHLVQRLAKPKGRVLSVLVVQEQEHFCAYLGLSWANQNLSPWSGGQIPITESVSNRAGYKLLESFDTFGIHVRCNDHALDLGAAPGAWTTLLRRRGLRVTAVAPTPLYPWLTFDDGVCYLPLRAEDYLNRCDTTFDLIVNDMKLTTQDSARLMVDFAQHLRPEGIAIMTFKLRERHINRMIDHGLRILRGAFKIIQVRQLISNRKEVTVFLRRK